MDGLGALFGELGIVFAMTVGPIAGACLVAGLLVERRAGQVEAVVRRRSSPTRASSTRSAARRTSSASARGSSSSRTSLKVAVVGAVVAMVVTPKLDELAALVGMPPAALMVELAKQTLSIALPRLRRLLLHRRRRLRLPAVLDREAAEDDQGRGQAGVQGPGGLGRGPRRAQAPADGGRPRPHDAGRPRGRRRRHEPDALRRRPEVRRRARPPRSSSPRARTSSPSRSATSRGRTACPSCPTRRSRARCTRRSRSAR